MTYQEIANLLTKQDVYVEFLSAEKTLNQKHSLI